MRAASAAPVEIRVGAPADLATTYADVPIAYDGRAVLDVVPVGRGLGGLRLVERALDVPWGKDYDAEPGDPPSAWPRRFDGRGWRGRGAWRRRRLVGVRGRRL